MGLDSVELVMEWEEFFNIKIPDLEASKISTIAKAVGHISTQVNYVDRGQDIKQEVLNDLLHALSASVSPTDLIFEVIAIKDEERWKTISNTTKYQLPFELTTFGKLVDKLFLSKLNYHETTVDRFVDLTCAVNYQSLIKQGEVQTPYEVMIAVMGITIEKIGVSPFEVFWNSSFTNDLGID